MHRAISITFLVQDRTCEVNPFPMNKKPARDYLAGKTSLSVEEVLYCLDNSKCLIKKSTAVTCADIKQSELQIASFTNNPVTWAMNRKTAKLILGKVICYSVQIFDQLLNGYGVYPFRRTISG